MKMVTVVRGPTGGVWSRGRPRLSAACGARRDRSRSVAARASDLDDLLSIVRGTHRGERVDTGVRQAVENVCDSLASSSAPVKVSETAISKTWRLVFTTEKETLFITSNARNLFGVSTDVEQIIDLRKGRGRLQNLISFANGAAFIVNSELGLDESPSRRANFKFTDAQVVVPSGSSFGLPPVWQGLGEISTLASDLARSLDLTLAPISLHFPPNSQFDTLYLSDQYRVAKDSRGDILVIESGGEPRFK